MKVQPVTVALFIIGCLTIILTTSKSVVSADTPIDEHLILNQKEGGVNDSGTDKIQEQDFHDDTANIMEWNHEEEHYQEDQYTRPLSTNLRKKNASSFTRNEEQDMPFEEEETYDSPPSMKPLDRLQVCLWLEEIPYRNNDGDSIVSLIPLSVELFNQGIFIQDSTQDECDAYEGGPYQCENMGSTLCSYCIYDSDLYDLFNSEFSSLPLCASQVTEIAEKCKTESCIDGSDPNDLSSTNSGQERKRNLLLYHDFLGNHKGRWITHLSNQLGSRKNTIQLKDFVLPGSHNSAAISMDSDWCGNGRTLWAEASRNKVAKCQEDPIWKQLWNGIRYLDLRIVDSSSFNNLRYPLHHTYLINSGYDRTLYDAIKTIDGFLNSNPGEFVIARIKARGGCGSRQGGWKNYFALLQRWFPRLQEYRSNDLNRSLGSLQGKIFVDISNKHWENYIGGEGVDGEEHSVNDGNPFEVARGLHNNSFKAKDDRFNIFSFFPAPTGDQLSYAVAQIFHDGLEDWDANFQKHVWLMHSLISRNKNVQAILRDRALTRKSIYHVATQLTLYRIFDKIDFDYGKVVTHEWVNEWDEKFEHTCPKGWIMQGFLSFHDNGREDRLWKFQCTRVPHKVHQTQWTSDKNGGWTVELNNNIWYKNRIENTWNNYDGNINFQFNCDNAITGIGGKHHNGHEDRRFWIYVSQMKNNSGRCHWTNWVNQYDGDMDFYTGENSFIAGIYSVHNNGREDRRWKFCTCAF
jgi:hypothetical protein